MNSDPISESAFLRDYTRDLHRKKAAVFGGAGLSVGAGYVTWDKLLSEAFSDLELKSDKENDLVAVAQYYCNKYNKHQLAQLIQDYFGKNARPTENHKILARLPIATYWTTNYDTLIQDALKDAGKTFYVHSDVGTLNITQANNDAVVYMMHGHVGRPNETVITKKDFERYATDKGPFLYFLQRDLTAQTFLFLGFSFTDPNLNHVLGRLRGFYEAPKNHFLVFRRAKDEYEERKQRYVINDLHDYGIGTVLIEEYDHLKLLLEKLEARYRRSSIFISGACESHDPSGDWTKDKTEHFLHNLGKQVLQHNNRLVTGFGAGVGSFVLTGALEYLYEHGMPLSEANVVLRPFPQSAVSGMDFEQSCTRYRRDLIEHAGIALFVFGDGRARAEAIREEFEICFEKGVKPLPIGATGHMAQELWKEVKNGFKKYFPNADKNFEDKFSTLNESTEPGILLATVQELIVILQTNALLK